MIPWPYCVILRGGSPAAAHRVRLPVFKFLRSRMIGRPGESSQQDDTKSADTSWFKRQFKHIESRRLGVFKKSSPASIRPLAEYLETVEIIMPPSECLRCWLISDFCQLDYDTTNSQVCKHQTIANINNGIVLYLHTS